ncbi:MAG TPA: hemolysin family protein, partial [Phycisphaerales bacterium]|nr:hemolysin family protein [Phycisphaerales bacterium]
STVQIGITLVGIFSGVYGGATIAEDLAAQLARIPALESVAAPLGLAIVVIAISYLSLVVGELAPKRLAIEHPEAVARLMAGPMEVLSRIASPAVHFLSFSTNLLLKPFAIGAQRAESVSEEEIRSVIRLGAASGVLQPQERELIERVFALADRRVGSFMIPRADVVCLAPDATRERAARLARETGDTHLPVAPGGLDELVGVVSLLDLASEPRSPAGALASAALFIPDTAHALRAIELFRRARAQIAFVTDEHGTIEGMIRLVDLVEDILGQVEGAEHHEEPDIVERADGSLLVDGLTPLADFLERIGPEGGEELGPHLELAAYQTVGGMVIHRLGRPAATGDLVVLGVWAFEVVDIDGRRIDKVLVRRAAPGTDQAGEGT